MRKWLARLRAGWDFVHVAVDDATRLAYVEVLADERHDTTTAFMLRALRWFREHGIRAERVMTDNGSAYRSRRFAKALRRLGIRHIFTRPYTPRTNGKVEKFIQTLPPEWAYGLCTSLSSRAWNRIAHPLSRADPPRDRRACDDALETNYQMKEDEVRVFTRAPSAALYGRGDLLLANGSATSSSTARL